MTPKTPKVRDVRLVFFTWMLTISLFTMALLTGYGLWVQYQNYQQGVKGLRESFQEEHKHLLRDKVNEAINFARFKAQTSETRLKKDIQARTNEA